MAVLHDTDRVMLFPRLGGLILEKSHCLENNSHEELVAQLS